MLKQIRCPMPQWLIGLLLALPGLAHADGYSAGAARVDTTPPPFDATADAAAFPLCPSAVYTGPRRFAFEEPYIDLNGNGRYDYGAVDADGNPDPGDPPEPYCDANANGRWDGIFISGGVDHQAVQVHDPLDARAIAISDGTHALILESIVEQGIFINVIDRIRARVAQLRPAVDPDFVIVSANHNEASPDTVGIYGAPDIEGAFGLHSGIDDYYVSFLVEQAAQAAVQAYDHMSAATLWATSFSIPANLTVRLSNNFPTTNDDGTPAAIDPK
ncbi:MAG TPA: hypothetical protein VHE37_05360, partial [Nevskiaceae bacterium]|nr:hypothetical protein [Nevskiaceae bacterium]